MTASPTPAPDDPLVEALTASYAAVFAYGLVGAHLPEPRRAFALQALGIHRVGRDWLRARIAEANGKPPPAAAAYDTGSVTNAEQAAALAAEVELALVPRWAAAAGVLPSPHRPYCSTQAQGSAVRALIWGAPAAAFPGSTAGPEPTGTGPASPSPSVTPTAPPTVTATATPTAATDVTG
jgi:hypothetical protein